MDAIDAKAHVSAHGAHTAPVMESENLPLEAWPRDKILSMIQECQEVPDPIILTSGAYYYPRGIYQLFETQDGARIGIWAEDPDDLALGDFIVTEEWSKKLRENGVQIPPGTVYKGNYLRDLGNGNLSRLRVFTARETYLGDKWFASETAKHNEAYLAYQEEQGRLIHDGGKRWLANGVVYQLVDNEAWLEGRGSKPYDLVVTAAAGPGWSLGHDFDHLFAGLSGKFMRAASLRMKGVTLEEGRDIALHDFTHRLNHLVNAQTPYKLAFNGDAAGHKSPSQRPWRSAIRRQFLSVVYATRQQKRGELIKLFAGLTAGNAAVYWLLLHIGMPPSVFVPVGKIAGQAVTRTGARIIEFMRRQEKLLTHDPIQKLIMDYTVDWEPSQLWGGRFNPECAPHLRAIPEDRMLLDRHFGHRPYPALPATHDGLANIYNPQLGDVEGFKLGEHDCFRIDSPNGLSVEFIPARKMRIALLKEPLPNCVHPVRRSVQAIFRAAPENHPFAVVEYDTTRRKYKVNYLTQHQYRLLAESIKKAPCPGKLHEGEKMPDLTGVGPRSKKGPMRQLAETVLGESTATALTEGTEETVETIVGTLGSGPKI